MSDFIINDESSNHKYRTELPNLIYEIGLTPALIGVYSALKRAAGDHGQCTKSEKTLSSKLFITKKTLHGLITQLCEVNSFLGKPLIILTHRFSEHGDKDTNAITIVDIWPENYSFFTEESGGRVNSTLPSVNITQPRVKSAQGVGQNLPQGRVKFTHKEEPIKKNNMKKQQQDAAVFFDCLNEDTRLDDENRKSLMPFGEERIKLAQEYSHKVKPKKGLMPQMVWHCQQDIPPKIPKENFWDQVKKDFKNEKIYNGALCYINSEGIAFERGITNLSAKFSDPSGREKFEAALKQFGIKWKYE